MKMTKFLPIGALALAVGLGTAPVQAAPAALVPTAPLAKADTSAGVTDVRYRHRHHHHGRNLALGLGVGVLGAIIASEAYRPRAGYYYDDEPYDGPYYRPSGYAGDARALCAQNFRSFEWNTGLYTTYDGDKRLCPYLR
jgi:hypothetical protein